MKPKRKCLFLCIASGLMFALGIARGIGGIFNLFNDKYVMAVFSSSVVLMVLLVIGFILLSAATFITAIAIFEHNKKYLAAGMIITLVFVILGVINAYLAAGKPVDQGTIINIIVALIVISLLMLGKRTLSKAEGA